MNSLASPMPKIDGPRVIVKQEKYGSSIELRDPDPDTRYLPEDKRSGFQKTIDRILAGVRGRSKFG